MNIKILTFFNICFFNFVLQNDVDEKVYCFSSSRQVGFFSRHLVVNLALYNQLLIDKCVRTRVEITDNVKLFMPSVYLV